MEAAELRVVPLMRLQESLIQVVVEDLLQLLEVLVQAADLELF